jgi:tRNA-intron endonuclease
MNQNLAFNSKLDGHIVKLDPDTKETLYNTSFYGNPKDGSLELTLIEAAYLTYKGRIKVTRNNKELDFKDLISYASMEKKNFEVKYIIYKDMRERGYFIKPGVRGFRVYPRGGRPGKTPSKYFVYTLSERNPMPLKDLVRQLGTTANMRKELVIAVVDEESDITFYGVKLRTMKGEMNENIPGQGIEATFLEDRVMVWDADASAVLHKHFFYGKPLDEVRLQLSLVEAAYLQEKNVLDLMDSSGDNLLTSMEFTDSAINLERDFQEKLSIYRDLRDSGMVAKTGYKFGTHYRVYKKIDRLDTMMHSQFLVHVVNIEHVFNLPQLSRAIRLAHSVRKQMVFAWRGGEKIMYLEIGRIKM